MAFFTRKRIFRFLLITFLSVVGLIITGVVILFTQQQRLTKLAVAELNKQFPGELMIGKSSVNLIENFPYVSIALHNVKFYEDKSRKTPPIYELGRLFVGFSLPEVLNQKYNVRRLILKDGYVNILKRTDGLVNIVEAQSFQADTTTSSASGNSNFEIDLQKMVLRKIAVTFTDSSSGQRFHTDIDRLETSFRRDSNMVALTLKTDMMVDITGPRDTTLFRNKHLELELAADLDKKTKAFALSSGTVKLQDAAFRVEGRADLSEKKYIDFRLKGEKPDINLLAAFIPNDVADLLKPFRYDGTIYFDATARGSFANGDLPLIEVDFGCENAWFLNTGAQRKLDEVGFKGFFTNGPEHNLKTSELRVINMNAKPGKGIFQGNLVLRDFTDPKVIMQVKSDLELQFVGEFLGIPDLKHITGKVKLDMDVRELVDVDMPEELLTRLKDGVQSELTVSDLSFRIPGYPHHVRNMNLHAEMKKGRIRLDSLALRIGNSDFRMNGSLSDLVAFLHNHQKPVTVEMNASSNRLVLKELFAHDTALSRKMEEEILGFNIGVVLQTSVNELRHPSPLPKGLFELKNLKASFKNYPHVFHHLGATVKINDSALVLRRFTGQIDSSDIHFSGRVNNYPLWFRDIKKGRTEIAFDFKSERLAMKDILGRVSRTYVPRGYRREEANNLWLRAKAELRYDTAFKFAKIRVANISGSLKRHKFELKEVSGGMLFGANKILKIDSLKGKVGRTDFDLNLRYYTGNNPELKKKTNYLYFKSKFIDGDQLSGYALAPAPARTGKRADSTEIHTVAYTTPTDTTSHKEAFNIFMIPFSDFEVKLDVDRFRYNRLWLQAVTAKLRMTEDHYIHIDTLGMKVADGIVGVRGYLNGANPEKIFFRSRIRVDDVDLEKMLIKLDHFGQDLVINKNIRGRLTGNIRSHVQVHPDLVPLIDGSKAELDIMIRDGVLVDFAPMQAMSSYFKDKNLKMVRFDTLKNVLSFNSGVLTIPNMNINSSLGFMEISGKQSIDLNMEYYMRIPLKMVTQVGFKALFGKKQEEVDMDRIDEIEYRDKDKKVRFVNVRVTGTPDDYKIGLGKEKKKK